MAKLQTIYQYFKDYTTEQVDAMLEKLTEEERVLITYRYGEDLSNPTAGKLTKEQTNKFYGSLVPKMRRLLSNPNKERKPRKKEQELQKKESKSEYIPVASTIPIPSETQNDSKNITKEACETVLELLRTPTFNQMMSVLSVKEAIIISLKLGYVDGKYFSTESIAQFLGIEVQEVIDTTRKVLLLYKENINQFIDNAIEIVTEQPKQLVKKS